MTRIAILGATSQIARDLIVAFSVEQDRQLHLFARRPAEVLSWLLMQGLPGRYPVDDFGAFAGHDFDVVINFVGVGNPAQAQALGNAIFDITWRFDQLVLDYLQTHPQCRYLFLSSGAAYGTGFNEPATKDTRAVVAINGLEPQAWYGVAKLHAECRHRALPERAIVDIRVFNYFSRSQDLSARFLITDMVRAIRDDAVLQTSLDYIVRDYLHPADFHRLVSVLIAAPAANAAVDCYTLAPVDKPALLAVMQQEFGLRYRTIEASAGVNATGGKPHYYSLNTRAADFGYRPGLSSIDGIVREAAAILQQLSLSLPKPAPVPVNSAGK